MSALGALLHLGALVPAALGTATMCCIRGSRLAPEQAATVLMLVGMLDAMTLQLLSPVWWFALLLLGAMSLAALRRRNYRSRAAEETTSAVGLAAHVALGLVVTAGLILLMPRMTPEIALAAESVPLAPSAHAHSSAEGLPVILAVALAVGHVALAAGGIRSERAWRHRLHHAAMASSTVAMAIIVTT